MLYDQHYEPYLRHVFLELGSDGRYVVRHDEALYQKTLTNDLRTTQKQLFACTM